MARDRFVLERFDLVDPGRGVALLRVGGRWPGTRSAPRLVVRHDEGFYMLHPLPQGGSVQDDGLSGALVAGYAVPTDLVGPRTAFALRFEDQPPIVLPRPRAITPAAAATHAAAPLPVALPRPVAPQRRRRGHDAGALARRGLPVVGLVMLAAGLALGAAITPLLALVAVALVLVGFLVLVRPFATLLVLMAALPWEGLLAFPSESVSAVKILGLALGISFLIGALGQGVTLRSSPVLAPAMAFGLLVGASLLVSLDPVAGVVKGLSYLLFIAFLFFIVQLVNDRAGVVKVLRVFALSAAAAAVYGLIAFLTGEETLAAGPVGDPNDFAFLLATSLPPAVYLITVDRRARPLWALACLVLLGAILATLSRGALAGLLALAAWGVLTRRVPIGGVLSGLGVGALLLSATFALFPVLLDERLDSKSRIADRNVQSRQAFWAAAVRMAADHPALGVGPGRFGVESGAYIRNNPLVLPDPSTHEAYLEILAENGAPALLAFLAFLATAWRILSQAYRAMRVQGDADGARLVTALQGALVVSLVCNLFLSQQLATPFWLIGGLAAAVASLQVARPFDTSVRRFMRPSVVST